jgi:CMP-N-acetylneuraminic acid synthetase|tara:strand:- start:1269 stop:2006 length:738 start_codon:yes stop_codon:yes gene_type:complete
MHIGLVIGKKNSIGVPGKNTRLIIGRPAAEYAFIAGAAAKLDKIYVSTDSDEIANIGKKYNAIHINRPLELATPDSLTEDVLTHAYNFIKSENKTKNIKTISLLFCNNPAINVKLLKEAISFTENTNEYDSCFSVVKYDMFSPARARKIDTKGEMQPFVELKHLDNVSSIRDSQGSCYFCDLSIQVMKPICFEEMDKGQLPFKWQGRKSKAIETDFGFDIDTEWQYVVIEYWLKKYGFTENSIPW